MDDLVDTCEVCTAARPRRLYAEAAKELRIQESWLRRHIKQLPHTKLGRTVYFTDDDLRRIDALFHHEPTAGPSVTVALPSRSVGAHPMGHLVPLPSRRSGSVSSSSQ
ncbi:helix-turn-helix domain-containing protein [Streptomyces misionensis]|uniref:helix-turn-helix domain-containing protein n=1 Tax=Streptomyces misionensis TaxID=67331 RepID=UPI003BB13CE5